MGGADDCLEQFQGCLDLLNERHILAVEHEINGPNTKTGDDLLVIMTKSDLPGADERMTLLKELLPHGWKLISVSVNIPDSLAMLRGAIFRQLGVIRVYSKIPGKEPEMANPFVLKKGQTVLDFAALVHRDFPKTLKYAKVWGSAKFPGQSVERDFRLEDRDVVELHV